MVDLLLYWNILWSVFTSKECVLSITLIGLLLLETNNPKLIFNTRDIIQSAKSNIGLFVINGIVMSIILATTKFTSLIPPHDYTTLEIILIFIVLDFVLYCWHWLAHKLDMLWMLHKVHHNDKCFNVTTAFRLHFVELILTNIIKFLFVILLQVDQVLLGLNEAISTMFVMFHHSNISFKHERLLSKVFIVPYLHRTHHAEWRQDHDSNYGTILSIWDRMFGTLLERDTIKVGIFGYSPQTIWKLIKFGFGDIIYELNTEVVEIPKPVPTVSTFEMIQTAAYYKALNRGFEHGKHLDDWLEAEREILNMLYFNRQRDNLKDFTVQGTNLNIQYA